MSIFLERIQKYAQTKKISLRQLSLDIGLSGAYMSNSLKQGSNPSIDFASKIIEKYPDLNAYWLLTGRGNMIINPDMVAEAGPAYWINNKTIDELIDDKIDIKLRTLSGRIRQMIVHEMKEQSEETDS